MKKSLVFLNSSMGLVNQLINILFTFFTRTLFVRYIGVELLGLNGTFTSVLGTLSLAELGFESAIVYSLYKPLHEGNQSEVNDIMNIFKLVYRGVGIFFIVASVVVLPFLRFILTGIEINRDVYIFFLLQAAASACTYFLAYKRALLFADRKDYITKGFDIAINVAFSLLQCWVIISTHSYFLYLILKIIQTYSANFIVHLHCKKQYPYLSKTKLNRTKFKEVMGNVKNVFAGKIAAYIYQSTDNLVISAFVGTINVGYFTNYSTVTKSLKNLTLSVLSPIMPIIGNFLVEDDTSQGREKVFLLYTHTRYLISLVIIIPLLVLIDDFIVMWVGADMLLPRMIPFLLALEYYIDLVHSATVDFIDASGLFKYSKYISAIGALTNVVTSLILVQFWGIVGVLLGTVISQMFFWVGRSYLTYFRCLNASAKHFVRYWIRNLIYAAVFAASFFLCITLYQRIAISSIIIRFILGGVMCEVIVIAVAVLAFMRLSEQRQVLAVVKNALTKKKTN